MSQDTTQNNKSTKSRDIQWVLRDIRAKYPAIQSQDIQFFSRIYYPIAILEIDMEEKSFEDFEFVQLTVLKLFALGHKEPEVIADLLGLSPNYVHRVLSLLEGYGHIKDSMLTETGRSSVETGKKIITMNVKQKFQADALNINLISLDRTISESLLNDLSETRLYAPHLSYGEGISIKQIEDELLNADLSRYKKQKGGVLHSNAMRINDVTCEGIKYAESYMMKLKDLSCPLVFTKRYDPSIEEFSKRFSWQPFSIPDLECAQRYGFDINTPIHSENTRITIEKLYNIAVEYANRELDNNADSFLDKICTFNKDNVVLFINDIQYDMPKVIYIEVNLKSFDLSDRRLKYLLMDMDDNNEILYTNNYLHGLMVRMATNDPDLIQLAREYKGG